MPVSKVIKVINKPRSDDLVALQMLRLRMAGRSRTEIAAALGCAVHVVRDQCARIREDDMAVPDPRATPGEYERFYR